MRHTSLANAGLPRNSQRRDALRQGTLGVVHCHDSRHDTELSLCGDGARCSILFSRLVVVRLAVTLSTRGEGWVGGGGATLVELVERSKRGLSVDGEARVGLTGICMASAFHCLFA